MNDEEKIHKSVELHTSNQKAYRFWNDVTREWYHYYPIDENDTLPENVVNNLHKDCIQQYLHRKMIQDFLIKTKQ